MRRTLDEYGLPPELAVTLTQQLAPTNEPGSLDEALERLRQLPTDGFGGFELTLLTEAKRDL